MVSFKIPEKWTKEDIEKFNAEKERKVDMQVKKWYKENKEMVDFEIEKEISRHMKRVTLNEKLNDELNLTVDITDIYNVPQASLFPKFFGIKPNYYHSYTHGKEKCEYAASLVREVNGVLMANPIYKVYDYSDCDGPWFRGECKLDLIVKLSEKECSLKNFFNWIIDKKVMKFIN